MCRPWALPIRWYLEKSHQETYGAAAIEARKAERTRLLSPVAQEMFFERLDDTGGLGVTNKRSRLNCKNT
jgi:hypothetical protein